MKEEFDKRLSNHIAEVFDNFEDPFSDAGWALLREKYPEKQKDSGVFWLWIGSAAAVLLLFLGIWIWGGNEHHQQSNKLVVKVQAEHKVIADTAKSSADQDNRIATSTKTDSQIALQSVPQPAPRNKASVTNKVLTPALTGKQSPMTVANTKPTNLQQTTTNTVEPGKAVVDKADEPKQDIASNSITTTRSVVDTSANKNIAQNNLKPVKPVVKSPFTENDLIIKKDKSTKQTDNTKAVTFGVYAATYVNYASGSSSQVNVGAGLASDIHLAKNLKLSTGVAVNQNTLDYGNNLPPRPGNVHLAALAVNVKLQTTMAAGIAAAFSYNIPVLKNYNAQLTSLDVPLNLKYEFNPDKSSSFISLGLSSGTFITEAYNSQYGYANTAAQTQSSNNSSFSNFYFAKTLDFSFGLGYPIGKNHLSVEPFVKYPLQGLGAEQIKFGAGGLNLKFNFSKK